MQFYRIVGSLILVFSGFGGAYVLNNTASLRYSQADALIAFFRFVRAQIECFAMPATEILSRCEKSLLIDCGFSVSEKAVGFEDLLRGLSIYDGELREITEGFIRNFGKSYREEQIKECDYYIERLLARRQKLFEELPNKKKVNSALCISSALAAVILLL